MTAPTPPPLLTTREALRMALCDALEPFADGEPFDEQECVEGVLMPVVLAHVVAVEDLEADEALVEAVWQGTLIARNKATIRSVLRALAAALTARAEAPK